LRGWTIDSSRLCIWFQLGFKIRLISWFVIAREANRTRWRRAKRKLVCLNVHVDISPRKKLIHIMPPNTDRPINRAMVVGCAVSATRNHLKLHKPRRLKILFSNNHAKTLKLWKHSAMRLATSRTNAAHQSANRPLMNSACPPWRSQSKD
jgi:hypothetical protein